MNAEALIGTVLGTCTLQKLIGQGGMGAVYLAQQSRPRRQVAVKVLLPVLPLAPDQRIAFLERFRRETDVVASLEHPNIMPVHEYGERDGLAYLVMPYVDGGTLRDEMEREGQLPLEKVMFYLEQMVAALEFAHESGVIHRDIKPANILLRREGRLLLTDFGLVKIITEGQDANARLTGVGMPLGTPDYMAPEQAMGGEVDARADLYSLGVILYQMVTGTVLFKGDLLMQVAMQHVHMPPPSPRSFRPDLPPAAEQVMLRALAKSPVDRYMRVQDLAVAFRLALTASGVPLPDFSSLLAPGVLTNAHLFTPRSLLDPTWQGATAGSTTRDNSAPVPGIASSTQHINSGMPRNDIIGKTSIPMPSLAAFLPQNTPLSATMAAQSVTTSPASDNIPATPRRSALGHKLSLRRPSDEAGTRPLTPPPSVDAEGQMPQSAQPVFAAPKGSGFRPSPAKPFGRSGLRPLTPPSSAGSGSLQPPAEESGMRPLTSPSSEASGLRPLASFMAMNANKQVPPAVPACGTELPELGTVTGQFHSASATRQLTGALVMGKVEMSESGNTSVMKLSQATKVIQVPVAGQPGRYVTGLLPVLEEPKSTLPPHLAIRVEALNSRLKGRLKLIILVAAVLLILFSSIAFWQVTSHNGQVAANKNLAAATPDVAATATVNALATANANIIVSDTLNGSSGNTHNWPIADHGPQLYAFKNGAYHITANDPHPAIALLQGTTTPDSFVYTLTMRAIKGDEGSVDNRFGMIIRFNPITKNGKKYATFYCFEVSNTNGGEYLFLKYDDSSATPWTKLWPGGANTLHYGKEFHAGHGANSKNTFKVIVNGSKFAFVVNGKRVGTARDRSLAGGQVGMFVNLQGTEIAFSNLLLTYN